MDDIDKLILEVEQSKRDINRQAPAISISDAEVPDAIVILQVEKVCQTCGSKWEHPNSNIMFRFGAAYKKASFYIKFLDTLPREVKTFEDTVPGCRKCYLGVELVKVIANG